MNNSIDNFNTDEILKEVDVVIQKGLKKILKDYADRYSLLEKTHKQIMTLPSVLNELNKNNSRAFDEECVVSDEDSYDESMFVSIKDMTRELVSEQVSNIENKINALEKQTKQIFAIFDTIMNKVDCINEKFDSIQKPIRDVKVIKYDAQATEIKENIKLEIHEEDETVVGVVYPVEPNEEQGNEEVVDEEQDDEGTNVQLEEPAVEKTEADECVEGEQEDDSLAEEEAFETEEHDEEDDAIETEEEDEEDEEDDAIETEEEDEQEEDDDAIETEEEDASENKEEPKQTQEEPKQTQEEPEEDEELFEIEIDDVAYCTDNEDSGFIFEFTEGEVGEKVGYFKDGEPFFYADEK